MSATKNSSFPTHFQQIFAAFRVFIAEACCHFAPPICIFLFSRVLASKFQQLLITEYATETNEIQREFYSNVRIATFETFPASKQSHKNTNLFKLLVETNLAFSLSWRRAVTSRRRWRFIAFADKLIAETLKCYPQTESKGNFCLITVYTHKTFPQPQNTRAKKQTFSNESALPLRSGATCCHFARSKRKGWEWGILSLHAADTSAVSNYILRNSTSTPSRVWSVGK
jgi:hypothetical protein